MIEKSLPTSSAQAAIYRDMQRFGGSHQISFFVRLAGEASPDAGELAVRRLIARHSLLSSTFHDARGDLRRVTRENMSLPFEVVDFSRASEESLQIDVATTAAQSFDLSTQPGVRFRWYVLGAKRHALLGMLHHMIYDHQTAVSLIASVLSEIAGEKFESLAVDHSAFVAREIAFLMSDDAQKARENASTLLQGRSLGLPTPPGPQGVQRSMTRVVNGADISRGETGTTVFQVVLAGWWATLQEWLGRSDFSLGTTMSLRLDRELRRVFGPVFQYVPIVIDITSNTARVEALRKTAIALSDAKRGAWLPLHELPGGQDLPLGFNANINFYNFDRLGASHPCNLIRRPGGWTANGITITEEQIPQAVLIRPYDLNLAVTLAGGRIALSLRWRPNLLSQEDASQLLSRLTTRLTT